MKNFLKLSLISALSAICFTIQAQPPSNSAGKIEDDYERLSLCIHVSPESIILEGDDVPERDHLQIRNVLEKRIQSIVTQNGFSGSNRSPKFMVFPTLAVDDVQYTTTAPTKAVYKILLNLYIADYIDQKAFNTVSLELTGIGSSKQAALHDAVNSLKNTREVKQFIEDGKKKILQYYNDQCDYILKEAEVLAQTRQYKTAFGILLQVPKECKSCYMRAIEKIPEYYALYQNQQCDEDLQKARVYWASKIEASETSVKAQIEKGEKTTEEEISDKFKKGEEDTPNKASAKQTITTTDKQQYYKALDYLLDILPGTDCYEEAQALLQRIEQYVEDEEYFNTRQRHQDAKDIISKAFELAIEEQQTQQLDLRKRRDEAAKALIFR